MAKFGGSSVADALQIEKIRKIIEDDGEIKYVVVSAPGKRFSEDSKITDLLYLCKTHIEHKIPYQQIFQVVRDRFMAVRVNLDVDVNLDREFDEIKKNLEDGASADYIASRGEYLNAMIIAAYLGYDFVDAAKMIKFDEKGRFMEELTNKEIKKELANHEKAVIPGFYGSKVDGSVRTFSRGGSDITGALVARAVEADVYENWTDVSGFLMADPRIVDNPKPISTVSYKELRELSYMGASRGRYISCQSCQYTYQYQKHQQTAGSGNHNNIGARSAGGRTDHRRYRGQQGFYRNSHVQEPDEQ